MTSPDLKRQKVLPRVGRTSVLVVGGSCLSLIGHYCSFQEFLCLRRTCTSIRDCTHERFLRWERYNEVLTDDEVLYSRCSDMYGFITSKIERPDNLLHRPDFVPQSYFPNSPQLARASMSSISPEVLLRLPLRLLIAMGGIDSLTLLPSTPLLDRHFRDVSLPRRCKALAFTTADFAAPITLCYDDMLTVIVFRCFLSIDALVPIVTHWYTCLSAFEWWCEFPHSPNDEIHYDMLLHDPPRSATWYYAVQLGQTPPSPLSFFRPYNHGPDSYMRTHSTVYVAMEYLETLVSARSVTHNSIMHQVETFVRLADFHPPVGKKTRLLAVLDWARTQIRLPLLFRTMPGPWSAYSALESSLAAVSGIPGKRVHNEWVLHRVPMDEYSELCDDEYFPLSQRCFHKRLPVLMEHFWCPIMLALHSLFSKGNRGLRPRITAHAVLSLQKASDILRHRLWKERDDVTIQLQRRHIPELLQLFKDVSREETPDFMPPRHAFSGFRTHEVMLFESCRLDSSFFNPEFLEDIHFNNHGEPSPEHMCNICSCTHWGNPNRVIHNFASTHATRARILREEHYGKHFYSRQQPTLCLLDPTFPADLAHLMSIAETRNRSIIVEVTVPAYHEGNAKRGALLNRLAVTWSLTNDELDELSAGRYYLHAVALLLEPHMNVCFVCDINYENADYKYISLVPSP